MQKPSIMGHFLEKKLSFWSRQSLNERFEQEGVLKLRRNSSQNALKERDTYRNWNPQPFWLVLRYSGKKWQNIDCNWKDSAKINWNFEETGPT